MATQIQLRRGTAASWTSSNPILAIGEPGFEFDTGKIKYGDGVTPWNSLAYSAGGSGTYAEKGSWATATLYAVGDVVTHGGQRYICKTQHTSGTFATDLTTTKWVSLDPGAAVPLAVAGQTPAQEPVASAPSAGVGSLAQAARADHTHPHTFGVYGFGALVGRAKQEFSAQLGSSATPGLPWNNVIMDGWPSSNYGSPFTLSGNVWTAGGLAFSCNNFTLDAGYIIKRSVPGQGLAFYCTGTLTINGSLNVDGESPAVGAAPVQGAGGTFTGAGGGLGSTGAGGSATSLGNAFSIGAYGASGGSGSGGTVAGGGDGGGNLQWGHHPGVTAWVYQFGSYNGTGAYHAQAVGSRGGGAGGGDGTNKGGSGGGGGGVILLVAKKIILGPSSVLSAKGGNGAAGAGGNAGGGGGGGAGAIVMHTLDLSIATGATIVATPGLGGAGVGTGTAGGPGGTNFRYADPVYGGGVHIDIWQ